MSFITRLEAIEIIMSELKENDLIISTTGMISREVFHVKERPGNFYMIGSMGLASSFGMGIAMINKNKRVVVLDGDFIESNLIRYSTFVLLWFFEEYLIPF